MSKTITITDKQIKKLALNWVEYLIKHPHKLFILEDTYESSEECLELIRNSTGFQITAFAGKAQNNNTHPERLPDLGELNLLARIRAIQRITEKPVRIILDGEYYAHIFGEEIKFIKEYEKSLKCLSRLVKLNQEYPRYNTFYTVNELLKYLKVDRNKFQTILDKLMKNPHNAYKEIEIYPQDIANSVRYILSQPLSRKLNDSNDIEKEILKISSHFIVHKAALSNMISLSKRKDKYQRVTILRYSKTKNPRINLEMNFAPWNSTILFKNNYLNINTTTNNSYRTLLADKRNFKIVDKKGYFLGFARNPKLFKTL